MNDQLKNEQKTSRYLYQSGLIHIAQFRLHPNDPNFCGPHQTSGGALVVFPRTSVTITHEGKKPVTASPNMVMFYNNGQVYSRGMVSEKGDLCDVFGFKTSLILDAIRPYRANVDETQALFEFSHGPSDSASYLMQRMIVNYIQSAEQPDHLLVDETIISILKQVIEHCYGLRKSHPLSKKAVSHEKDVVEALRRLLSLQFEKDISLNLLASHVNYSPFHLCRIFQRHTGKSIHQYLKELRLRTALEFATQPNTDLSYLALQVGFSSHSHFTEAFRKTFGIPPTHLRGVSRKKINELKRKISIA